MFIQCYDRMRNAKMFLDNFWSALVMVSKVRPYFGLQSVTRTNVYCVTQEVETRAAFHILYTNIQSVRTSDTDNSICLTSL